MKKMVKLLVLKLCLVSVFMAPVQAFVYQLSDEQQVEKVAELSDRVTIEDGTVKILSQPSPLLFVGGSCVCLTSWGFGGGLLYLTMETEKKWAKILGMLTSASLAGLGGVYCTHVVDLFEKRLEKDFNKSFITINKDGVTFGGGFFKQGESFFPWKEIENLRQLVQVYDGSSQYFLHFSLRDESNALTYKNALIHQPYYAEPGVIVYEKILPINFEDFYAVVEFYWRSYYNKKLYGMLCKEETFGQELEAHFSEKQCVVNKENESILSDKKKVVVESGSELSIEGLQFDDLINIIVEPNGVLHLKDVDIKTKADIDKDTLFFLCKQGATVTFDNVTVSDFMFKVQGNFIVKQGGVVFKDCNVVYDSKEESLISSGSMFALEDSHFNYVVDDSSEEKIEPLIFEDENSIFHCSGKVYLASLKHKLLFQKGTFFAEAYAAVYLRGIDGGVLYFGDGQHEENDMSIVLGEGSRIDILEGEFHFDNVASDG